MAYMNQEKKKVIAQRVKPILEKYGVKGTFAVRNHSAICLNIQKGKIDFIRNYSEIAVSEGRARPSRASLDVNMYWYKEQFSGEALLFLIEVERALKGQEWFDKSDIQSDHFHTAYYINVNIGQWNKPYVCE